MTRQQRNRTRAILISTVLLVLVVVSGLMEWQDYVNDRSGYDVCEVKPRICQ